ncbi:MAG: hypothetical protein U0414_31810 [Polyangiaceae bacterium]
MSAAGRSEGRVEHDNYPTPSWCVERLLEAVPLPGGNWLEPAAGDGAIIHAVSRLREDIRWQAIEIRPECRNWLQQTGAGIAIGDARKVRWDKRVQRVIITNPPYSLAEDFLAKALQSSAIIVLLLRLDFLGSERRAPIFRRAAPDVYVLPNRPSFVRGRTDANEYGWFVWEEDRRAVGRVRVLASTPREIRCPAIGRRREPLLLS